MKEIWNFLKKRFKDNDSVFWMYFFVIVCGVGAAGIWANIFPAIVAWDWGRLKIESLAGALYTFFPPVLVGACADILLPDTNTKTIRMFAIVLLILTFSWLMLCANLSGWWAISLGAVGCIIAAFAWIIANGEDPTYKQGNAAVSVAAGDTTKEVSGNTEGYGV